MNKKNNIENEEEEDISTITDSWNKLSKWKKAVIAASLFSDLKNRKKIGHETIPVKKEIIKNFSGTAIKSEYINKLFWIYNDIEKDIYIPSNIKRYLPCFKVIIAYDDKTREINLQKYLAVLKDIRSLFIYLKNTKSEIQENNKIQLEDEIFTQRDLSVEFEKQDTRHKQLYEEKINSEVVEIGKRISRGEFTLIDVFQFYIFNLALINSGGNMGREFSFKNHFSKEQMEKEFIVDDLEVTLKEFIRILKDLKIEYHKLN